MALDHGAVVHLVDVIGGKNEDFLGSAGGDFGQIGTDRVRRSAIAVEPQPVSIADFEAARELVSPFDRKMSDQASWQVLGGDQELWQSRPHGIGNRKVHQLSAGERYRGFALARREFVKPCPLTTGEQNAKGVGNRDLGGRRKGHVRPPEGGGNEIPKGADCSQQGEDILR